ncbi:Formyltetrahydrofolate deformylase [uncultured Pleomorphomonas sp.]|uniref:Formyltetrahydrofolate deformylase n=2 Tax=Pleomorphomonas TaxID=261933 RepID=A0A2G9WYV2_9HYPH|nr:formyltetrahydrofolate deformylase [Pleomorphomonas carboxyditropha]PIO99853.1 formyltetrahydrofolate deformylase [Pleomorphomonas carboxyditropha]SCM77318.1 Formyltetrahydrofolate deformylase [uncultured Pleomorphomonas sp.]
MADAPKRTHILTLSCADRPRIVASVTTILAGLGGNIAESAQFWDRATNRFFMRIAFETPAALSADTIRAALSDTIETFGMTVDLVDAARTPKIVIMVSKFDHCLQHLMYQIRVGWLKAEVAAIVSNHEDSRAFAEAQGIPYHCWPVDKDKSNKAEQEARVMALVEETGAELVVLARYMQVLSDTFSSTLFGRIINIHHSFLPSFKGARPYHQAHERGVKLIGATAHYVTPDLDEGPIIEQETSRVTHALSAEDLVAVGRDNESRVLARAVKLHLEARVLMHGKKTIVFA